MSQINATWDITVKQEYSGKKFLSTNTEVFPIPREEEAINIVLEDGSEYYGKVKKIEYYFNIKDREKHIYVLVY